MKIMKGIVTLITVLFLLSPLAALADDGFYVITVPGKPLKNVVTVSPAKGKFTDPVAAVASITDASATNPYLVAIGPGVYTITSPIVMKPYVDIAGSGQNVTKITGAISGGSPSASAIISGASSSTLKALTVENTGGGSYSIVLYNPPSSVAMISNITATARGGSANYAVYNDSASPLLTDMTAIGIGGLGLSCGIYNSGPSSPTLINITAEGTGQYGYGFFGADFGLPAPVIRRSTLRGNLGALSAQYGRVTVSQSTIIGSVIGSGIKTCVFCDNGSGIALGLDCLAPVVP